jgi:hypothetical protein
MKKEEASIYQITIQEANKRKFNITDQYRI